RPPASPPRDGAPGCAAAPSPATDGRPQVVPNKSTPLLPFRRTGGAVHTDRMFEVTLRDRTREFNEGADAYRQEGQMTTFFRNANGHEVVDCWSTRIASFRTAEILIIRRREAEPIAALRPA